MGKIWFRAKIYNYNKKDEKTYLKAGKNKWYHIMEIREKDRDFLECHDHHLGRYKTHYGLAEYIDEDDPLYSLVSVIDYSMDGSYLLFACTGPIKDEDKASIKLLKEYIEGQISDGAWENGIYLLDRYIGNAVKHYLVEDEIEQVVPHPFKCDEHMRHIYIPGDAQTISDLVNAWAAKRKKENEEEM